MKYISYNGLMWDPYYVFWKREKYDQAIRWIGKRGQKLDGFSLARHSISDNNKKSSNPRLSKNKEVTTVPVWYHRNTGEVRT